MPAESWIVEIARQYHLETVETEFATDQGCLVEIHAGRPLCRNQLDEGTAIFGHDDALTARYGRGGFGEASFGLAYREFHGEFPTVPTPRAA